MSLLDGGQTAACGSLWVGTIMSTLRYCLLNALSQEHVRSHYFVQHFSSDKGRAAQAWRAHAHNAVAHTVTTMKPTPRQMIQKANHGAKNSSVFLCLCRLRFSFRSSKAGERGEDLPFTEASQHRWAVIAASRKTLRWFPVVVIPSRGYSGQQTCEGGGQRKKSRVFVCVCGT